MTTARTRYTCSLCNLHFDDKDKCDEHCRQHDQDVPYVTVNLEFSGGNWNMRIVNADVYMRHTDNPPRVAGWCDIEAGSLNWSCTIPESRLAEGKEAVRKSALNKLSWMRKKLNEAMGCL